MARKNSKDEDKVVVIGEQHMVALADGRVVNIDGVKLKLDSFTDSDAVRNIADSFEDVYEDLIEDEDEDRDEDDSDLDDLDDDDSSGELDAVKDEDVE